MTIQPKFAKTHLLFPSAADSTAPVIVDLFVDYCCPFSAKLFIKWHDEVLPALKDKHKGRFQIIFRHVVQPWHPTSTLMHEVALAVAQVAPEKFTEFSYGMFKEAPTWFDGPTYDKTRKQIYQELCEFAAKTTGLDISSKLYDIVSIKSDTGNTGNGVTVDVKYFTRYHRTVGVHMTPTIAVGGIVASNIESSTSPEDVITILEKSL